MGLYTRSNPKRGSYGLRASAEWVIAEANSCFPYEIASMPPRSFGVSHILAASLLWLYPILCGETRVLAIFHQGLTELPCSYHCRHTSRLFPCRFNAFVPPTGASYGDASHFMWGKARYAWDFLRYSTKCTEQQSCTNFNP
jgi:hypothetical protein